MQYFKTKYEIPLFNWIMIQENGLDLSYLLKKPIKLTDIKRKRLNKQYMKILSSLKNVNSELMKNYVNWLVLLTEHRANNLQKKAQRLIKEDYDFTVKELERAFRDYLESVQKNYHQFEITEYYFRSDYKKAFEELFTDKVPSGTVELLKPFEKIRFYTWDEYAIFLNQFDINFMFQHPGFKKAFIQSRTVKMDSLVKLDEYLLDIYSNAGWYDDYQFVRAAIFDINKLKCEPKEHHSQFEEVAAISEIMGFQINPKETMLAEYESLQERAKQKAERSQEKLNKPNPA
jgi:hypothetical protein